MIGTRAFSIVCVGLIFPLAITHQIGSDLGFAFETNLHVGFIAIIAGLSEKVWRASTLPYKSTLLPFLL
jgi:hypothetical protein